MKYRMVLEYDGTGYCGWQAQAGQPTVQSTVENAMAVVLRERVTIVGSGRTDCKSLVCELLTVLIKHPAQGLLEKCSVDALFVQVISALYDLYEKDGAETVSGLCGTRSLSLRTDDNQALDSARGFFPL